MSSTPAYSKKDTLAAISGSWMGKNVDFSVPPNDEKVTAALKEKWNQVVKLLLVSTSTSSTAAINTKQASRWWDRIVDLHSAPDRAYHTLAHLHEMIGYFELFASSQSSDDDELTTIMVLSVLFHDAVYDARSATNEEDSAKLLQEFCRDMGSVDEKLEERIVQYILATKSHKLPEAGNNDPNLALFLDIDMAVLGKEDSAYLHYASLIRKEYGFVDRDVYCQKRADILETFLEEPNIFASAIMQEALEQQARDNLCKEIRLLRTGVIPGEATTREVEK
eukprot:CAMPEP_0119021430 /NCGR_PEP_ID=MMETSP1176-20130426/25982_1 /TAXON_ID=265551 /ORGANISM="Synedropsis recta cf, Strain CCMP1620" /LENGTH=278 /DNA_ID=CAMNT_0006976039 /DNA_START=24 /DNA_END=860 /DNA_ORIENTATION=-